MREPDLDRLRAAGRIAAAARDLGARLVTAGARVRDVCDAVEQEIVALGGRPAFPAQSSRNAVAAHYCPSPDDETRYETGDLAKLDVGVHIEGWVVDTALTVSVSGGAESQNLVDATRAALEAAIAAAGPGVPVRTVSTAIAQALREHGVQPIQNLCGHGVDRWTVHGPPAILNVPDHASTRLEAGMVVAIEPFGTTGVGQAVERGTPEVFRLAPARVLRVAIDRELEAALRAFNGLPFSRRQLSGVDRDLLEDALARLRRSGDLSAYPPLVEESGHLVAQAEHTVYVGKTGVEVLTL